MVWSDKKALKKKKKKRPVEQTHTIFQALFETLTSPQFQSLKAGSPDSAFGYLDSVHMYKGEEYIPSFEATLFEIISQYMGNTELHHSSVWNCLSNMIDEEILKNVSTAMYIGFHNEGATRTRCSTSISRLARMVQCLLQILSEVPFNKPPPSPPQIHEGETEDIRENSIFDDGEFETDIDLQNSTDIDFLIVRTRNM